MKDLMMRGLKLVEVLVVVAVVALLAGIAIPKARADTGATSLLSTNQIVAGTALTISAFEVEKEDNCGFQLSFAATNANSAAITTVLFRSGDNVTFETYNPIVFSVSANGTTPVCQYTNISNVYIGAAGYFKGYITNAGGADLTNTVFQVIKKTVKPST